MTYSNTIYVNGGRVRTRLLELEMSERDLSRRSGVGQSAIRALLRTNQSHTSLTVAQLQALAREVGLTPAEMLTPDQPPEPATDDEDMARMLLAVLLHERRLVPWEHLADAFGWSTQDLRDAARSANRRIHGTGLRVHTAHSGLTLRPDDQPVGEVTAAVDRLRARDDSMDNGTARVLYEVVTGSIAQGQIRKGYAPRLGYLRNQGIVHVGRAGEKFIAVSEDVAFAFDV